MAKVDFQNGTSATVKVSGRSVTDAPPTTVPVGPRSFPPPPPPPPPPPTPLGVVNVTTADVFGLAVVRVTFDGSPVIDAIPNWELTGGDPANQIAIGNAGLDGIDLFIDGALPTAVVIAPAATGVHSSDGGDVVPGTYPIV